MLNYQRVIIDFMGYPWLLPRLDFNGISSGGAARIAEDGAGLGGFGPSHVMATGPEQVLTMNSTLTHLFLRLGGLALGCFVFFFSKFKTPKKILVNLVRSQLMF